MVRSLLVLLLACINIVSVFATHTSYVNPERLQPQPVPSAAWLEQEYKRFSKVAFADSFDTFDFTVWQHEISMSGGGNWEFEYYLNNRTNSFVQNSTLFIRPTMTADRFGEGPLENGLSLDLWGGEPAASCTNNFQYGCVRSSSGGNIVNPIQSARVRSVKGFNTQYGRLEVTAKLPRGDWIWPAIWMLPVYNEYGDWPASGEIDIMESRGNDASYAAGGNNKFSSTLHWGPGYPYDPYTLTHAERTMPGSTLTDDFHVFGVSWSDQGIVTYIDNMTQSNYLLYVPFNESFWQRGGYSKSSMNNPWAGGTNGAPFDKLFHVVLNVAVGGTGGYFPDGIGNKPWSDTSQHAATDFWHNRAQWVPTWPNSNDVALQVSDIKLYTE